MRRLTITLSDARHKAIKEASARLGLPIGTLIDKSLEAYGIRSATELDAIIRKARRNANLSERDAMKIALEETRSARRAARSRQ